MTGDEKCDILIVGAGPAGISTALHLAQFAPNLAERVLILDKEHHPRLKLCGGGLTIDAETILRRLGLDVSEIPHVDAPRLHLDFAGKGLRFRQNRGRVLRIIRRDEFDSWLGDKARNKGITIKEGILIKSLVFTDAGITIETDKGRLHAKIVVGADGSNGVVRHSFLPHPIGSTARALEVLALSTDSGGHLPREAYFDFAPVSAGIAGYTWDFPSQLQGQPVRVWGIYDANLAPGEKRPPLKELLAAEMLRHGYRLDDCQLQGHPIHLFDPYSSFSAPHVLLAGDAAGVDPLFGEGISMALGYGLVAAQAIHKAYSGQDFSFRNYRHRLLSSPLGRILTIRWLIANILYSLRWRWIQLLIWRILKPVVSLVSSIAVINWAKWMRADYK